MRRAFYESALDEVARLHGLPESVCVEMREHLPAEFNAALICLGTELFFRELPRPAISKSAVGKKRTRQFARFARNCRAPRDACREFWCIAIFNRRTFSSATARHT